MILKGQCAVNSITSLCAAEWPEHSLQSKIQVRVLVLPLPHCGLRQQRGDSSQTVNGTSTSSMAREPGLCPDRKRLWPSTCPSRSHFSYRIRKKNRLPPKPIYSNIGSKWRRLMIRATVLISQPSEGIPLTWGVSVLTPQG